MYPYLDSVSSRVLLCEFHKYFFVDEYLDDIDWWADYSESSIIRIEFSFYIYI